jgi:hypothetical protein
MKFLLATLLTSVLSCIACTFFPWWSIAIISFIIALLLHQKIILGFLAGFSGIFLLWFIIALWIDIKNESILSQKIALIFPLGGSSVLLMLVTAFVGGMVGGFAAMAGSSLRPASRTRHVSRVKNY